MADLFKDASKDWDARSTVVLLSEGIGSEVVQRVPLRSDWRVMDFGAGTGLISSHVAEHVNEIVAVDISESMLQVLANKPALQGKVRTVCQDILEEPLDERFDLIMSAMAMHHVNDTTALFKRFADHLAPGGQLALADLDKEDGSFHPADMEGVYHAGFERETLRALCEQHGFVDVAFSTAHTVQKEDRRYPVFLMTAVKA